MASKIAAASIVTQAGGACIIASGHDDDVLGKVCRGEPVGTLFSGPRETRAPSA
jgi:glutamate 5-kinase